jgi:hypothetical protein
MRWTNRQRLLPLLALILLSKCSGGDQAQGEDPVTQGSSQQGSQNASLNGGPSENGDETAAQGASMNNAVENSGGGNFGNGGNGGEDIANGGNAPINGGSDDSEALGASLNNSLPDETMTQTSNTGLKGGNASLNGGNPQAVPLNSTNQALNEGNVPTNQNAALAETPTEGAAAQPQATAAQPASGDPRAAASPFTNPQMNWPGKGKVKYVTRQVTRHSAPNGPVIGEFEKGEHPLIYQNGNWVELHDGSFVKGNGLSDQAVGYGKGKKHWH